MINIFHWPIQIKKILPIFLFFSSSVYAFDLEKQTILIPKNTLWVGEDSQAMVPEGFKYSIMAKSFSPGKKIKIKKNNVNDTPEKFLESLFFSYVNKDQKLMLSYFTENGKAMINKLDRDKFSRQQETLSKIKSPLIQYVLEYKDGLIISWYDESFASSRKVYIKLKNKEYKMHHFYAGSDEHFFANVNLYFNSAPFLSFSPKIDKSFTKISTGETKTMSFNTSKKGNYIHFFKAGEKKIKMSLRDNYFQKEFPLNDLSAKDNYIEVKFKGENFKDPGKHELLYLESTYPMAYITKSDLNNAKTLVIEKIE